MAIDDCIDWLCRLRSKVLIFMPCAWHEKMTDALTMAIETMRKYQKIQEIVAKWKVDSWTDNLSYECMIKIAEIIDNSESEEV